MFRTFVFPVIAALITTVFGTSHATAAETSSTSITIEGMHCAGCAKKIATRLRAVSGVADAQVSVETGTASVTAKDKSNVSPRTLWETIEKAGYTPTKLVGPSGSFTKKPEK